MKYLVVALCLSLSVFALTTAWTDIVYPQLVIQAQQSQPPREDNPPRKPRTNSVRRRDEVVFNEDESVVSHERNEHVVDDSSPEVEVSETSKETSAKRAKDSRHVAELSSLTNTQEAKLAARQETLRILYDDIRNELSAIDGYRLHALDELEQARRRLTEAAQFSTPNPQRNSSSEFRVPPVDPGMASNDSRPSLQRLRPQSRLTSKGSSHPTLRKRSNLNKAPDRERQATNQKLNLQQSTFTDHSSP